ncbi:protein grainyhead [Hetaerina americana]|uniref:protein grainyhead n=1 Tax=Hetaerina americana TaxID=62018 RepID=UPI003A7F37AF
MHGGGDQQIVTTVLVLSEEEFNQSLGKRKELVGQGDVEEADFPAGTQQSPHPRSAAPPPRAPMSSAAAAAAAAQAAAAAAAAAAASAATSPSSSGNISGGQGAAGRGGCGHGDISAEGNGNQGNTGPGGQGPEEETWSRSYYEHPLTAATAAMLNIGGGCGVGGPEEQVSSPAGTAMGFIYEYYKLPVLPLSAGSGDKDKDKLVDVWPTTSASMSGSVGGALMTSASHGKQSANGLSPGGQGLGSSSTPDLLHPPPLVPVSLHQQQSSTSSSSPSPASPHHHQHHVVHHGHHHQHQQQHQQQQHQQQQLHHAPDLGIFLSANEESDNFGGQGGGTDGDHLHPSQHHSGHQFGNGGGNGSSPSHHFSPHLHQGSAGGGGGQSPHHHLQHHHPHLHSTHHYLSVKREPEDLSQPVSLARGSKGAGDGRVGTPSPLLEQSSAGGGGGGGAVHALKERAKAAAAAAGISIVVNGGGASSPGCVKEEPNGVGNRPCSASSAASSVLVDPSSELVVVTAEGLKGGVVMSGGGGGVVVSAPPKGGSTSNPSTPSSSSSPGAPSAPSYSIFANIGSGHHQQSHQTHQQQQQQQHQQFTDHVSAAPHQYGLVPVSQGYSLAAGTGSNGAGNNVVSNLRTTSSSSSSSTSSSASSTPAATTAYSLVAADPYYRDYFGDQYQVRQQVQYADSPEGGGAPAASFVERYVRQGSVAYKSGPAANPAAPSGGVGLTVDLPSPDSGIGADAITPRDQTTIQQSFDYTDLCQAPLLGDPALTAQRSSAGGAAGAAGGGGGAAGAAAAAAAIGAGTASPGVGGATAGGRSRPWHDFGRQNDADKVQIPKVFSLYGFKYFLETPISTSQRREDDRITYINKGQFYGISLEYSPDPDRPALKSQTVKSVVMLMFREEKSPEDEIKAWQFWHGRQHSVKQRILDADTKNSVGLIGCIEEVAHNAIAVYWNPMESSAKINVAVQCLSTDFSSQKGVKGLPLHLQIDTYEDPRESSVYHRGYCQIKVFCDKGAERKTRDEERRAAKRKMTATGRKKMDELYHPVCERSEFYAMADLGKPPVLFSPAEDIDKLTSMELQGFYGHDPDNSSLSNGEAGSNVTAPSSSFLLHSNNKQPGTTLKFHNHFPPEGSGDKKDSLESLTGPDGVVFPAIKRPKMGAHSPHLHPNSPHHVSHVTSPHHHHLHLHPHHLGQHTPLGPPPPPSGGGSPALPPPLPPPPMQPPLSERVMLYVRQETDNVYTPLHVVPPSAAGLLNAIENKYKISTSSISNLYRKNKKGIMAKIDDDMLKYYCNEDLFILDIKPSPDGEDTFDITLTELMD